VKGGARRLRDLCRFGFELAVGEAEGPIARDEVRGVAPAIGVEAGAGAVVGPAVDLDDEPVAREEESDGVLRRGAR
jgi:hypothetical protein